MTFNGSTISPRRQDAKQRGERDPLVPWRFLIPGGRRLGVGGPHRHRRGFRRLWVLWTAVLRTAVLRTADTANLPETGLASRAPGMDAVPFRFAPALPGLPPSLGLVDGGLADGGYREPARNGLGIAGSRATGDTANLPETGLASRAPGPRWIPRTCPKRAWHRGLQGGQRAHGRHLPDPAEALSWNSPAPRACLRRGGAEAVYTLSNKESLWIPAQHHLVQPRPLPRACSACGNA